MQVVGKGIETVPPEGLVVSDGTWSWRADETVEWPGWEAWLGGLHFRRDVELHRRHSMRRSAGPEVHDSRLPVHAEYDDNFTTYNFATSDPGQYIHNNPQGYSTESSRCH